MLPVHEFLTATLRVTDTDGEYREAAGPSLSLTGLQRSWFSVYFSRLYKETEHYCSLSDWSAQKFVHLSL